MYSKLDNYIPFVKYMVLPYLFWYIYIIMALVYLGFNHRGDFYRLSFFMFAGMTICFIIYMKFPNGQNLRPIIVEKDFFSRIIKSIYSKDTPTNSAPSMHVLNSIAVHIAIIKCVAFKKNVWIKWGSFITMVLIILSTVMIKQHSILDVIYGIGLSIGLYLLTYKMDILQYYTSDKAPSVNTYQ